MATFDKIIQSAAENLYGDERLRSNLTDDEGKIVLDWALGRISVQVNAAHHEVAAKLAAQKELARVRPVVAALNASIRQAGRSPG